MKKNTFISGALIATLGIVFTKFLGVIYVIPFYRLIGEESIALYGYAYTIYNLFLSLSTIGIPPAISKIVSEYNTKEEYYTKERVYKIGQRMLNVLGIVLFVIIFVFAPQISNLIIGNNIGGNSKESITFVIRIISTAILIVPLLSITKGYLQGHKYITPSTNSQIIEQIVRIFIILFGSYLILKVFDLGVTNAVGIAVFGATGGAISALCYLLFKIKRNKHLFPKDVIIKEEEKQVTNKYLIKKILICSFPFVMLGITISIYDTIDMLTVVNTLAGKLDYLTKDAESIIGVLNTTGNKLNSIVTAIAMGLSISLIPNITSSFVTKNISDVKKKITESLMIIIYITLPLSIGLSILAEPVFYAFYGINKWGYIVFRYSVFIAVFSALLTVSCFILHSINKYKNLYISIGVGILVKLILNVPLTELFNTLNIYPFYGAITASILGLIISIIINTYSINKDYKLEFKNFFSKFIRIIYPLIIMVIVILLLKIFIPFNMEHRSTTILVVSIYAVVGGSIYLFITYKNKVMVDIFGSKIINKLIGKS